MGKPLHLTANRAFHLTVLLIASAIAPSTSGALAQEAPSLPGGASSLQEAYGDWRVACQIVEATKRCALPGVRLQENPALADHLALKLGKG